MNKSEKFDHLPKALLAAQREIGAANKGAVNPFFRSKYADLGSVMESCKSALNMNGIAVLQPVGHDESGDYVETILLHDSGEWLSDKMRIVIAKQNDPQAQGSAITYARRYSLQSLVFIPAEDDDAEKAVDRTTPEPAPIVLSAVGKVLNVEMKIDKSAAGKQYTKWTVSMAGGYVLTTLNKTFGDIAISAKKNDWTMIIQYKKTQYGLDIVKIDQTKETETIVDDIAEIA